MQAPVTQNLATYAVHIFIRGDHMLQHKVPGAYGPTSPDAHQQLAPYCTTARDAVCDYSRQTRPLAITHKCNALLKGISMGQHQPDILHSIRNVQFTSVFPLVEDLSMSDLQ